jgi:hypothetical protein
MPPCIFANDIDEGVQFLVEFSHFLGMQAHGRLLSRDEFSVIFDPSCGLRFKVSHHDERIFQLPMLILGAMQWRSFGRQRAKKYTTSE